MFDVQKGKISLKDATTQIEKMGDQLEKTASTGQRLTSRLRELKDQIGKEDFGSKRFTELSIEAAKLEDHIGDVGTRIRNLASDTRHLDALISGVQGLAGAFAVAQGAGALLGTENADLQKGLLKIQASLAILNGLQQVQATVMTESAAKTAIVTTAQKAYTFVTEAATFATKAFRAALLATGAGVVLAALGVIITYWEDIKKAVASARGEVEKYNANQDQSQDVLRRKQSISRKKADLKDNEDILKSKILLTESLLEVIKSGTQEELDLRLRLNKEQTELELNNWELTEKEKTLIELRALKEREKLRLEFATKQLKKTLKFTLDIPDEGFVSPFDNIINTIPEVEKEIEGLTALITKLPEGTDTGVIAVLNQQLEAAKLHLAKLREEFGLVKTDVHLPQLTQSKTEWEQLSETIRDTANAVAEYTGALASSAGSLAGIAKQGSAAQIALAEISILASYAQSIANAIAGATASGMATGGAAIFTTPGFIATLVATTVGAFAASFANLQKAKSLQSGGNGSTTATAFAEGEVDIHRPGEKRGKDSIPAVIMPGESVMTTEATRQYKPFLEAIHAGNLEDLIRVNYIEPALAVKALDHVANDSKQIDYSERFYRQYLATGEGNINGKRMVKILASIDHKLTPKQSRYSH